MNRTLRALAPALLGALVSSSLAGPPVARAAEPDPPPAPVEAPAAAPEPDAAEPDAAEPDAAEPDAAEPDAAEPEPQIDPGVLPALVGLVPGVLVHGVGHMVAGDTDTGLTLLGVQGIGLGLVALGGVPLAATGASRKLIGPASAVALTGVGLLLTPVLPDIYGALTGGRDARAPARVPLTLRLGYAWIYDPQFDYRHFTTLGYVARFDALTLDGSGWIAVDDDNQRLRQRLDWRLWGRNVGPASHDGALDLQTAVTWHRFGSDGFSRLSGELAIDGLYPLDRLSRTLRGSFALGRLGYALEFYDYDVPGLGFGEDVAEQLLIRFGWGFWFADRGSVSVYYDHRKDDYAGGFSAPGLGGGIPGYLGLAADYALDDTWALDLDVRRGSAWIAGLGLRYRYGAR